MVSDSSFGRSWTTSAGSYLPGGWRWLPLALVLVLAGIGWWTFQRVERSMKGAVARELQALLDADVEALKLWVGGQFNAAEALADRTLVKTAAAELGALSQQPSGALALRDAPVTEQLNTLMADQARGMGFVGYALLGPDGTTLACPESEMIGDREIDDHCQVMAGIRSGETFISLPFFSPVPVTDAQGVRRTDMPMMFVATPVRDADGGLLGALGLRIRPDETFSRILEVARSGESGETYAFNERGVMISHSRFGDQLRALGMLAPDETSVLNVEIRDPGVDLTTGAEPTRPRKQQPLTRMAAAAISGESGIDVDGYRDYRGVEVIGAWTWLDDFNFGVATEVDVAEALRPLAILRSTFVILFGLLVVAAAALVFSSRLFFVMKRRMRGAMKQAERLGQYTLDEKIGEGGMGEVYRASHVLLRRPTALKLLHPDRNTEKDLKRFEREVQLTSRLTHPNTVAIYDYGHTAGGVFYYAMEYLEGVTLAQLVAKTGPVAEARVIHLLRQVCASLAEAHGQQLIHRDIKPANIMVCARGGIYDLVKLLDFGLVKDTGNEETVNVTAADVIAGTPHYLAPEAIRSGGAADARSDLYAVGVTGYYLLTGSEPFKGRSATELLAQHLSDVPEAPTQRLGRSVSKDLESVILSCMAKDPADRPQSAEDLIGALSACVDAGRWTREDARRWWESDGQACALPTGDGRSGSTHSMFIEVDERQAAVMSR